MKHLLLTLLILAPFTVCAQSNGLTWKAEYAKMGWKHDEPADQLKVAGYLLEKGARTQKFGGIIGLTGVVGGALLAIPESTQGISPYVSAGGGLVALITYLAGANQIRLGGLVLKAYPNAFAIPLNKAKD